ncbi:putative period circadian protein [Zalerion maritima]|uniref:Period circadian protein n=1 Tax=Zalerion maritima TaxID=339359 RepID=A0AAD5RKJ1_9PEZI|nr:putative period circadian protein [Zalerion maritima]
MSSMVNKAKSTIAEKKAGQDNNRTPNYSESSYPYQSQTANAADPRVDTTTTGAHSHGAHKEQTSSDNYARGNEHHMAGANPLGGNTHNAYESREGESGPHSSRTANAVDPRVDSDRDGRTYGRDTHNTTSKTTAGPHKSDALNKADPRVDSDRDGKTYGRSTGAYGAREGEHGPHSSRMANTADPRFDSDRDGSRTAGNNQHSTMAAGFGNTGGYGTADGSKTYGTTRNTGGASGQGYGTREGEHGPHEARAANAADPRVDSDRDGSSRMNPGHSSGPAPNTAGPHKSDMLNKMDPRVDSDLDGSKTHGGNKTFQ